VLPSKAIKNVLKSPATKNWLKIHDPIATVQCECGASGSHNMRVSEIYGNIYCENCDYILVEGLATRNEEILTLLDYYNLVISPNIDECPWGAFYLLLGKSEWGYFLSALDTPANFAISEQYLRDKFFENCGCSRGLRSLYFEMLLCLRLSQKGVDFTNEAITQTRNTEAEILYDILATQQPNDRAMDIGCSPEIIVESAAYEFQNMGIEDPLSALAYPVYLYIQHCLLNDIDQFNTVIKTKIEKRSIN
jgi:hypothetical protein